MNLDDCLASATDLADTGSSQSLLLIVCALALVGIGVALLLTRRSRAALLALALVVGSAAALTVTPTSANAQTVCTASLAGETWADANSDGLRQDSEQPISGVTITLLNENGDTLATTTTGSDGAYSFAKLPAGGYRVAFPTTVSKMALTTYQSGDTTRDSDADTDGRTQTITLTDGQHVGDIDAGYITDAATPTPTSATPSPTTTSATPSPTTTSATPSPTTSSPAATGRIGDQVWIDSNSDGIQNEAQPAAGVTVTLLNAAGDTVDTTVTDANGSYMFFNVPAGSYRVRFPTSIPNTYVPTLTNQGSDAARDSDATELGTTALFTLAPGEFNNTIDAGYINVG